MGDEERGGDGSHIVLWQGVGTISLPISAEAHVTAVAVHHQVLLWTDDDDDDAAATTLVCDWDLQRCWSRTNNSSAPLRAPAPGLGGAAAAAGTDGVPAAAVVVVVAGGCCSRDDAADSHRGVKIFNFDDNGAWTEWLTLTQPRWFASAIAIPSDGKVLVIGGCSSPTGTLTDSVEAYMADANNQLPRTFPTVLPKGPIMASATVLVPLIGKRQALLILGGYNGSTWSTDCQWYEFSAGSVESGTWRVNASDHDEFTSLPAPLPDAVRFGKAVSVPKTLQVILGGESCSRQGCVVVQCLDLATGAWLWCKYDTQLLSMDALSLVRDRLFCLGRTRCADERLSMYGRSRIEYGAFTCDLASLESSRDGDGDSIAPPIAGPVAMVDSTVIQNVLKIEMTDGLSRYSGQMRKAGDTWIPHGEGLEEWADEKKMYSPLHLMKNSFYRGSYKDGYRDGMGEMHLKPEGRFYTGQFVKGNWHGLGRLEIRSKEFTYFGNFAAGERSGYGRCTFLHATTSPGPGNSTVPHRKMLVYAGYWVRGLAEGEGIVTDHETGEVVESGVFHKEDLVG